MAWAAAKRFYDASGVEATEGGFAVTLAIGIVTSMFTAIMLTRLLVVTWLRRTKPAQLPL